MSDWYAAWAEHHCTVFGMTTEADLKTVLSWEPILCVAGDQESLADATEWLATNLSVLNEYRFIGRLPGHLASVQRALREVMAVTPPASLDDEKFGVCAICNSTGRVLVPRLESVRNGEWRPIASRVGRPTYQSYLVACSCKLGTWWAGNRTPITGKSYLTLDDYTARNPRWRIQVERRAEEARQQSKLAGPVEWQKAVDSLVAKFSIEERP